jgi:hypothetical protein
MPDEVTQDFRKQIPPGDWVKHLNRGRGAVSRFADDSAL